MQATVTVRVDPRAFDRGVKSVKKMGGRYNPQTKTWDIPADRPELGNLGGYGLLLVEESSTPSAPAAARPRTTPPADTKVCWECGRTMTLAEVRRHDGDWYDEVGAGTCYCGC